MSADRARGANLSRAINKESGSILVLTLWILTILSIFSLAVGYQVRQRLRYLQTFEIRDKLRDIADAGIQKGVLVLHQRDGSQPDHLGSRWANSPEDFYQIPVGEGTYTVTYQTEAGGVYYGLTDEERKINLNKTDSLQILSRVFEYGTGISRREAQDIAASIKDWRDSDDHLNEGGAESRYYRGLTSPYRAKDADFDVLEELLLVKGITPEIFARISPYITLDGHKIININTASDAVLRSFGLSERLVEKIRLYQAGRDRVRGTSDDRVFTNAPSIAEDVEGAVGLDASEFSSLRDFAESGIFDVRSHSFMIRSHARLNHRKEALARICVVASEGELRICREFFYRADEGPEILLFP